MSLAGKHPTSIKIPVISNRILVELIKKFWLIHFQAELKIIQPDPFSPVQITAVDHCEMPNRHIKRNKVRRLRRLRLQRAGNSPDAVPGDVWLSVLFRLALSEAAWLIHCAHTSTQVELIRECRVSRFGLVGEKGRTREMLLRHCARNAHARSLLCTIPCFCAI